MTTVMPRGSVFIVLLLVVAMSWQSATQTGFVSPTAVTVINTTSPLQTTTTAFYWPNTSSASQCVNSCGVRIEQGGIYSWSSFYITATLTYATVLYIISNDTGSTRTTTIYNTELGTETPPSYTNAAGTVVTTFSTWNPYLNTSLPVTIAYPTVSTVYPYYIEWLGKLSTTIDGTGECITRRTFTSELLPSHPNEPQGPPVTSAAADPKGWTYFPTFEYDWWNPLQCYNDNGSFCLPQLFPDVGALHACTEYPPVAYAAEAYGETASFLTVTSTTHEAAVASATPSSTPPSPSSNSAFLPQSSVTPNLPSSTSPPFISSTSLTSTSASTDGIPTSIPANAPASFSTSSDIPNPNTASSPTSEQISGQTFITSGQSQDRGSGSPTTVLVVAGHTLTAGHATTISGTFYSLASDASAIVIGSTTEAIPPTRIVGPDVTTGPPLLTLATTTLIPDASTQYIVEGQILTPGGVITLSGATVSLAQGASYIVVAGSTEALQPNTVVTTAPLLITLAATTLTPDSSTQYTVAGQTLTRGGIITLSGTTISLAPQASYVVIGSTTLTLNLATPAATKTASLPLVTLPSTTLTPDLSSNYLIGTATLAQGQALTLSGTYYSLAASASYIVIDSSTFSLTPSPAFISDPPPITLPSTTLTPNFLSDYLIGSQTLSPGSALTVSGTYYSLAASASYIVIDSSTLSLQRLAYHLTTAPPVLTLGASGGGEIITITPDFSSDYIIGTQTLVPGGQITEQGTVYSLAPGASYVVVGGSTETLSPSTYYVAVASDVGTSSVGASATAVSTVYSVSQGTSYAVVVAGSSTQTVYVVTRSLGSTTTTVSSRTTSMSSGTAASSGIMGTQTTMTSVGAAKGRVSDIDGLRLVLFSAFVGMICLGFL